MLRSVFFQVLVMSAAGSALWLPLRALRPAAGRFCSASWQAGARLPVLCAFLLPVGLAARTGAEALGRLVPAPAARGVTAPPPAPPAAAQGLGAVWAGAAELEAAALWDVLAWIWLVGVLALSVLALLRQVRFQRRLRRTRLPVEEPAALALLEATAGGRRLKAGLYRSDAVSTPLGVGLLRPAIYLPEMTMEREELALVLRHELTHLLRRDLWRKWAVLAVTALHWFNPLSWAFSRELGMLCEAACDEVVVRGLDSAGRRFYGETLLNVLSRTAPSRGVCSTICGGKSGLKFRLRRILQPVRRRGGQAVCTAVTAALFCAFVPCAAAVQGLIPSAAVWTLADCRAWMAESNRKYEALGVAYDADTDTFSYRGERVALLLDERIMGAEERAMCPWISKSFDLYFVDREAGDGPCLAAVRDDSGRLAGLRTLLPDEAAEYLAPEGEPVTYHSFTIQRGSLYACDPAFADLPAELRIWAGESRAGTVTARLDGENGSLCYPDLHCPWELSIDADGVLEFRLYLLEGNIETAPTVVRFAADRPVTGVRAWLDGVYRDVAIE